MSADSTMKIKVQGVEYDLDMDKLTLGELEEIEDATGRSLSDMDQGSVKTMNALAWIAKRRKAPMTTLDDIRQLTAGDIEVVEDEDPTQAVEVDGASTVESSGNPS